MTRSVVTCSTRLSICLMAMLCTEAAYSQVAPAEADRSVSTSSSSVAYVYVSNAKNIYGYSAVSDGKLTPVADSPFPGDVSSMAVNGKYLFGTNGVNIYSFSIASDGALKQVASIDALKYNGGNCGFVNSLFLDHTGKTLYDFDYDCSNSGFQSFRIDKSTGGLSYLGVSSQSNQFVPGPLSFIGNNIYAYGSGCPGFEDLIYGFKRSGDGALINEINGLLPEPTAKEGDFYCPYLAAADPTNHLAISVQTISGTFRPEGPPLLATYTAEDSGDLTTKSTYENMPEAAVGNINDINMSPSGKLLAVGGSAGLQVFHFNGSRPITHYTGVLTTDEIAQLSWDNNNHLYAISHHAGKLFVFTITPTSATEASGSPHTISGLQSISVLSK